jgi:hypothetical protein
MVKWTVVPAGALAGVAERVMVSPPEVSVAVAVWPVVVVVVDRTVVVVVAMVLVVVGPTVVVVRRAAVVGGAALEVGLPASVTAVVLGDWAPAVPAPGAP